MTAGLIFSAGFSAAVYLIGLACCVHWRKVGGIYHWRLGRFGGCVYYKSFVVSEAVATPLVRR